jgi:putative endonuclease
MLERHYYVYILASQKYGTLYTGITSTLIKRTYAHKENWIKGFTQRYGVHRLVYFEIHNDVHAAITREKQIKKWRRDWKINLIEKDNPEWLD